MNKEPLFIGEFRQDGRKAKENRELKVKMNITKDSNGSCMLSLGQTKVISWINGPRESKSRTQEKKGSVKCIFTQAPFSGMIRKKDFKRDLKMREFSKILKDIFEQIIRLDLYAKSEIIINVLVLQNDGNYKSASINAITFALINAGIYIKDSVVGINVGCSEDDIFIYDLQLQEEKQYIPILNVAFLPHTKKLVYTELVNAKTPYNKLSLLMKEAEYASLILYNEKKKILLQEYYNKDE